MNKTDCKLERVSNMTLGFFLVAFGLLFSIFAMTILPVLGFMIAIPLFILGGIFLNSPRSKACALIVQKARGTFTG